MIGKKIIILNVIINSYLIIFFLPNVFPQDVIIKIGKGFGAPESSNSRVEISLENSQHKVKGLQVRICDEGNLLSATGCETIGRASGFDCSAYENRKTGCATVVLFSMGPLIVEGEGPVAVVSFDVSRAASSGDCVSLNAYLGAKPTTGRSAGGVSDENNNPLEAGTDPGEFCFVGDDKSNKTTTTSLSTTPATTTTPVTTTKEGSNITTTVKNSSNVNLGASTGSNRAIPALDRDRITAESTVEEIEEGEATGTATTTKSVPETEDLPVQSAEKKVKTTPTETTTVPRPSPYRLVVSPSSIILVSGGLMKFSAKTYSGEDISEGKYTWKIVPPSTIGSSIDENGLFSVGSNTADFNILETVVVTDTFHEKITSTASVIINTRETIPAGCELSINLLSATVFPGDVIRFFANNSGGKCKKGSFQWKVNSKIDSRISAKGIYTAGNNDTGSSVIDFIIAKDIANKTGKSAMVTVLPGGTSGAAPDSTRKHGGKNQSEEKDSLQPVIIAVFAFVLLIGLMLYLRRRQ